MRLNYTPLLLTASLAAVLLMSGCLAPQGESTPRLGSESHFLMSCFSETDCPSGLGCICGVCTASCQTELQCSSIRLGAAADGFSTVCSAEAGLGTAALCGPFTEPPGLCVAECTVVADCGAVAGRFVCDLGRCRDADLPSNGQDASVPDVSDAGTEDAPDADGGAGDASVDVDDLELVECDGDLISTREQFEALVGCQRITSDLTIRDIPMSSADVAALVDVQGSFRVLNVVVADAELRFDALRRVTGDFTIQAVDGASSGVAAVGLESAMNVDIAGLTTGALLLDSLTDVGGTCVIADAVVGNVALPALRAVGETLSVRDVGTLRLLSLPSLESADALELEGLSELESASAGRLTGSLSGLSVAGLTSLLTLDLGTPSLTDSLRIQRMNTWTDLSALAGVRSGANMTSIVLSENALLRTSDGFAMTTSLAAGALLNIERNPRMTELGALENIATIGAGARLSVSANASLPQCAVSAWLISASAEVSEETVDDVAGGNDASAVCE
ncbi:MAG: hypothetical protein ACI81R_002255 [Bradymonadia bacterium]|jgi:hypothetical protein